MNLAFHMSVGWMDLKIGLLNNVLRFIDIFIIKTITFASFMLKPKTENFKVKVMLYKLEAVSNKVTSRCHASIRIGKTSNIKMEKNYISRQHPNSKRTLHSSTLKYKLIISLFIWIKLQDFMRKRKQS